LMGKNKQTIKFSSKINGNPPFTALEIDAAIEANDAFVVALERIVAAR